MVILQMGGDLEKSSEAIKGVRSTFNNEIFPSGSVREDELTLREGEALEY